jgi:hypothetical protein
LSQLNIILSFEAKRWTTFIRYVSLCVSSITCCFLFLIFNFSSTFVHHEWIQANFTLTIDRCCHRYKNIKKNQKRSFLVKLRRFNRVILISNDRWMAEFLSNYANYTNTLHSPSGYEHWNKSNTWKRTQTSCLLHMIIQHERKCRNFSAL